jgi:hypothetical protein
MEYLCDLYSVWITIEMADGKLIFSARPPPGAPTVGTESSPDTPITSAEVYPSMAGAKQHNDTGFILIPVVGRMSSRGALKALYCVASLCLQRGATSVAGEEVRPPSP